MKWNDDIPPPTKQLYSSNIHRCVLNYIRLAKKN